MRVVQAKQEREAVRSVHGEQQAVRLRELRMRHELSQERRKSTLLGIVARATDESDKVREVQFIRRMEATSLRAALDARLERSGERRRVVLANRQLRHGRDVDETLEDAQRRKRCAASQELLFRGSRPLQACLCQSDNRQIEASESRYFTPAVWTTEVRTAALICRGGCHPTKKLCVFLATPRGYVW